MKKIIFILIAFALYQAWHKSNIDSSNPISVAAKHEKVVLYATSWCGYCKKTRELLVENKVEYTEYDVEASELGRQQHEKLGGNGVPVLDIKGTVLHGYDEDTIISTLKSKHLI